MAPRARALLIPRFFFLPLPPELPRAYASFKEGLYLITVQRFPTVHLVHVVTSLAYASEVVVVMWWGEAVVNTRAPLRGVVCRRSRARLRFSAGRARLIRTLVSPSSPCDSPFAFCALKVPRTD